ESIVLPVTNVHLYTYTHTHIETGRHTHTHTHTHTQSVSLFYTSHTTRTHKHACARIHTHTCAHTHLSVLHSFSQISDHPDNESVRAGLVAVHVHYIPSYSCLSYPSLLKSLYPSLFSSCS